MRRKIDVTAREMLELREAGYSNKDIAEMCEVSVVTVRRYIGNQGRKIESVYPTASRVNFTEDSRPQVKCVSQTIAVDGFLFKREGNAISVCSGGEEWITIAADRIASLQTALTVAQETFSGERWTQ